MIAAEVVLAAGERTRLAECSQEQIHVPGAIQPHGVLVAVDPHTLTIVQVSENSADILGVEPSALLGTWLGRLVQPSARRRLQAALRSDAGSASTLVAVLVDGRRFDTIVHQVDALGIVEFEPAGQPADGSEQLPALHTAIQHLSTAPDIGQLLAQAAREMRRLTGFDQVMVYHFQRDGHGEVVADDHRAGMTTYLGLHFPGSDIPVQARRLYMRKRSGLIASSDYRPAALVPADNPRTGAPLDLTLAELRSVSPHHLQFMRNMGQGASLTLPLVIGGELLGMITCAHRQPRRVAFLLRQAAEILAQSVALQWDAMIRTQRLSLRIAARDVRNLLIEQMDAEHDVAVGLLGPEVSVLDILAADGATVCLHHQLSSIGQAPERAQTAAVLAKLTGDDSSLSPLMTQALRLDRPDLAQLMPAVAGLFVLPFGGPGDCLIWFRREIAQTVDWLGEQSPQNRRSVLEPRNSFDMWRQTVSDRSTAWDEMQVAEAAELGRDVDQVLLRRAEAQLAHMGLHDALTGLPNRILLMERIAAALRRAERDGNDVALLFCDLDGFKRVNDTAGHAAGDAVLVEAAARLSASVRVGDTVARVGGDEFVVLLEPAWAREPTTLLPAGPLPDSPTAALEATDLRDVAAQIAGRVRRELCRPVDHHGEEHVVSVSVGMTFAAPGDSAEDLLRDADAAMYRAKHSGKNRVETFDDSLRAGIVERARAERALRSALGPDGPGGAQLGVAFQPVVDLDSGRLVSFEVLARLSDSDGSLSPDLFTSVAEQTGLINPLGASVLDAGLAGLARWRVEHPGDATVTLAVNFSARQAQHADMPSLVRAMLDRNGCVPSDLTLELTESVLIAAGSDTLRQLTELHDAGVAISIDDFGTGFASLRYLAILPVDAVKVDKSFTAGLPDDAASATIVRAIAALAADMGLACVVEGIETERQLKALPTGVLGQGHLLGRPSPTPMSAWPSAPPDGRAVSPGAGR